MSYQLQWLVHSLPADVCAAEAVHEEVAGEAEQLEVVGAGAEDGEPDRPSSRKPPSDTVLIFHLSGIK